MKNLVNCMFSLDQPVYRGCIYEQLDELYFVLTSQCSETVYRKKKVASLLVYS